MDELTASLAGSVYVSVTPNSTATAHPRFAQYKCKTDFASQSERRRRYLELQKQKRFDFASYVRCLADNVWEDVETDDDDEQDAEDDNMDVDKVQLRKPGRNYRNQLMLSEWMLEVPENFAEDWVMVPCPVGKRSLIIASNGSTKAYARNGYQLNSFPSCLPGGCRQHRHGYSRSDNSVLDCIYSEVDRTYYVLDMMCWASYPIYDSESDFRFFWLQTKLQETPDVFTTSKINPYRFEVLPRIACSTEALSSFITGAFQFELDGLLFYHKRTHYTFGPSPLVVWLKAYMLPEILSISVPAELLALAPSTYSGFSAHAETVRQRKQENQQKADDVKTKAFERRRCRGESGQVDGEISSPAADGMDEADSASSERVTAACQ